MILEGDLVCTSESSLDDPLSYADLMSMKKQLRYLEDSEFKSLTLGLLEENPDSRVSLEVVISKIEQLLLSMVVHNRAYSQAPAVAVEAVKDKNSLSI